jgi:hypothetical protein
MAKADGNEPLQRWTEIRITLANHIEIKNVIIVLSKPNVETSSGD